MTEGGEDQLVAVTLKFAWKKLTGHLQHFDPVEIQQDTLCTLHAH
jgi:hypothetical protein